MKTTASLLAFAAWALGLAACVTATTPPQPLPEPTPAPTPVATSPAMPPPGADTLPVPGKMGETPIDATHRVCHLPAPKKSDDACKIDADCAPSDPCHAKACVARAKGKPRTADVMCTMMMGCDTADANRCGCFEGRCSLIPPDDAAKD